MKETTYGRTLLQDLQRLLHIMICWRLLKALRDDKHEIFRAARDAHKAADLLIALEHNKSLDQAVADINKPLASAEPQATHAVARVIPCRSEGQSFEMEL